MTTVVERARYRLAAEQMFAECGIGVDDGHITSVVDRMFVICDENPSNFTLLAPMHGADDIGLCVECDAVRALRSMD